MSQVNQAFTNAEAGHSAAKANKHGIKLQHKKTIKEIRTERAEQDRYQTGLRMRIENREPTAYKTKQMKKELILSEIYSEELAIDEMEKIAINNYNKIFFVQNQEEVKKAKELVEKIIRNHTLVFNTYSDVSMWLENKEEPGEKEQKEASLTSLRTSQTLYYLNEIKKVADKYQVKEIDIPTFTAETAAKALLENANPIFNQDGVFEYLELIIEHMFVYGECPFCFSDTIYDMQCLDYKWIDGPNKKWEELTLKILSPKLNWIKCCQELDKMWTIVGRDSPLIEKWFKKEVEDLYPRLRKRTQIGIIEEDCN